MGKHQKRQDTLLWKTAAVIDLAIMTYAFSYALTGFKTGLEKISDNPAVSQSNPTMNESADFRNESFPERQYYR